MNVEEKTLGESRVRIDFNVSRSKEVDEIKYRSAVLINIAEQMRAKNNSGEEANPEKERLISLAQTAYEEASMWLVKAVTI